MLLIHKASAGSGKTYNLVFEYLKVLLGEKTECGYVLDEHPNDNHKKILAITFTNKATEEMKKRIVKELDYIARNSKKSDHADSLVNVFGTKQEKLQKSAQKALTDVLCDYSNFNVSTIDSFFQLILRAFAFDVDLIGNYNVELKDDFVFSVGVSDLKKNLHFKNSNRFIKDWITEYMRSSIKSGKSWDIFRESKTYNSNDVSLNSFAQQLKTENVKKYHKELVQWIKNDNVLKQFRNRLENILKSDLRKILELARSLYEILASGNGYSSRAITFFAKFQNYSGNDSELEKSKYFTSMLADDITEKQLCNKGAEDPETVHRMGREIGELLRHKATATAILENIHMLGLLGEIESNITDFSTDNNIILLSNTNEILQRIINREDAPYIYERVGTRIMNFLIDEFQDTSRMQWENLKPLLEESLSGGNDDLIIGDIKQSIYRFRNSDPHLLREYVEENFKSYIVGNADGARSIPNINWRSYRNVVRFNNTFFSVLAEKMKLSKYYENVAQQVAVSKKDTCGYVRYEVIKSAEGEETPSLQDDRIRRTIETVQDMLKRNYSQKDIAILVNVNSEGREIINAFMDYQPKEGEMPINVISEESLCISNSPVIQTVIGALVALDASLESANKEGWSESESKKSINIKDFERRLEYNISQGFDMETAISNAVNGKGQEFDIQGILSDKEPRSLDKIIDLVIDKFIEDKEVLKSQTPFIQAFHDAVLNYMDFYGSNIHEFLKWWNVVSDKLTISSPDNVDAVNVMTIHKSKGLEFPCVIIPFCDWDFDKDGGIEWVEVDDKIREFVRIDGEEDVVMPPILPIKRNKVNSSLECFEEPLEKEKDNSKLDTLNKTYVAFTRAKCELVMFNSGRLKDLGNAMKDIFEKGSNKSDSEMYVNLEECYSDGLFELGEQQIYKTEESDGKDDDDEPKPILKTMPDFALTIDENRYSYKEIDYVDRSDMSRYEGTMKHRIMERVIVPSDLEHAVYFVRCKGYITEEEAEQYKSEISEALQDPRVQEWFSPEAKVRNEVDVVSVSRGSKLVRKFKRPDRIVQTPDGRTIVIDYKFGENVEEQHVVQVNEYVKILRTAGYQNVSGKIWYVSDGKIMDI